MGVGVVTAWRPSRVGLPEPEPEAEAEADISVYGLGSVRDERRASGGGGSTYICRSGDVDVDVQHEDVPVVQNVPNAHRASTSTNADTDPRRERAGALEAC